MVTATPLTLDAGALIALERGDRVTSSRMRAAVLEGVVRVVPTVVLTQVWRHPSRQVTLARVLRGCQVEPLTEELAREAGLLCAAAGTTDAVDAVVMASARSRGGAVLTSDPDDLGRLAAVPGRRVRVVPV